MNLLDENIPEHQRQLLRGWHILVRQIGADVGHKGIADDAIIVLLHQLPRPTFFMRDADFYQKGLCHPAYCLIHVAVSQYEVASFVRRFLRHPQFGTHIRRRGVVVRGPRQVTRLASQRGSRGGRFLARCGRAWWGCSPQTKVILRGL